jgi:hypothetical protein
MATDNQSTELSNNSGGSGETKSTRPKIKEVKIRNNTNQSIEVEVNDGKVEFIKFMPFESKVIPEAYLELEYMKNLLLINSLFKEVK